MQSSTEVKEGLVAFYDAFNSHDPDRFDAAIAQGDGVSVIGSAPGEGHDDRDTWIGTYRKFISQLGLRMEGGPAPRCFATDGAGYAADALAFVTPDGGRLPGRVTFVLVEEAGTWKVAHMHFSVGVPDEEAMAKAADWAAGG